MSDEITPAKDEITPTKFDPKRHTIRVQGGREYLPVAARVTWFRQEHPDWGIVTSPVEINLEKRYAIFSAKIFNAEGKVIATATKMENIQGFADFLEKSETGSVGRALAYCGYGTPNDAELDEGERFADAPRGGRGRQDQGGYQRRAPQGRMGPPRRDDEPQDASAQGDHAGDSREIAGNRCSEEGCPNVLTVGQMTMSNIKYGRPLCLLHQRGAQEVQR